MKRVLVMICAVGAVGLLMGAGPRARVKRVPKPVTQALIAADALWNAAAAEQDAGKQRAAWRAAAQAFDVVADDETVPVLERADAMYAAMVAWKQALGVDVRVRPAVEAVDGEPASEEPTPFEPDEAALFHALERYLGVPHAAGDDEVVGVLFVRATMLRRHNRFAEADPAFAAIIAEHPAHEVAEYAAQLLLDDLNRQRRYDDLVALADQLRANPAMVGGRPELKGVVDAIHLQGQRKRAEALDKEARETGRRETYTAAAQRYLAIHDDVAGGAPRGTKIDRGELLYNAMAAFQSAGDADAAVAAGNRLVREYTGSPHLGRARARIAVIEAGRARYAAALDALEAYVRTERKAARPARDVVDAASDAVYYAVALAQPARAAGIIDLVAPTLADHERLAAETTIVRSYTGIGKRGRVAARATSVVALARKVRATEGLSQTLASLGGALAAAACPVELVDELCPKPRTKALVAAATKVLARVKPADEPWVEAYATRLALDLQLEVTRDATPLAADYEQLLETPTVEAAAAALRLAGIARRAKRTHDAILHYRRCILAEHQLTDGRWIDACERGLAALGAPDADLVPELRASPSAATVEPSTEGP